MERAPWWGGFYERLIRTVKLALRKTVGRATLFRDELETLLIEIEGVLNSRPLTYIFSEFNEPEPLTPSHMILGRRVNSLPPARLNFDSNFSNRKVLIKRFNYRERLLNMFWTKWSKEYICMLKSAHWAKPTSEIKEFKIDDVVLINDEKFPRHFWKLGKVVDVFPGRDGKIRSFHSYDFEDLFNSIDLYDIIKKIMVDFHKRILFSDEAHFWLNGYVNKQNCRIWSEANPQVYVETPLHPEILTVWCALWAGGILLQKR
ncbi:integrase catalytic domain-containing protein [Trichonephila clavipes]|nr:integrase catalytic domain-containing protein [Trichonephila clavipes]